ncbi:MAG TPA: hypothetical protein VHW09_00865 [Bryobacteraceae bacterium]|nr:hypothetical protein [Bryobacteraceae bacterium]
MPISNAGTDPGLGRPQGPLHTDNRTPSSADRPGRDILTLSMDISDVYLGMGQDAFDRLVRSISIGRLKTFQMYEGFKVRAHLSKVNTELLRKSVPKFWARVEAREEDFGKDLAQCILVSHLEMIVAILDFLGVPHENGFFAKDMDPKPYFTEGWEERVYRQFRERFPEPLLVFYVNHLRWELLGATELYRPASPSAA